MGDIAIGGRALRMLTRSRVVGDATMQEDANRRIGPRSALGAQARPLHGPSSRLKQLLQPPVSTQLANPLCPEHLQIRFPQTLKPSYPETHTLANMAGDPRALLRQVGLSLEHSLNTND
jgi:hypothetical protein